ncbi:MAG: DUF2491 family protein [Gammaproteobacteria bacterium]|nr:MAG: DUF2491 family protein [Gammaproteobacteria bacterium]
MQWFGSGKTQSDSANLPYGARLRAAVRFDDLTYKLYADKFGFDWPQSPQIVEAIGDIDLGEGNRLYRLYLTDDAFIQIATANGQAGDVNLFVYAESINPSNQADFERWCSSGAPARYRVGDYEYARVWGEGPTTQRVPLEERVYKKDLVTHEYDLTLYTMLYSREVEGFDRDEMLLVAGEDSGPNDYVVSQAIGIPLTTAEFEIT